MLIYEREDKKKKRMLKINLRNVLEILEIKSTHFFMIVALTGP
jgi:hypothetical protein